MNRTEGEKLRAIHHLRRLRTIVDQVIGDLEKGAPIPGPDVMQAVAHTGVDVARSLSALAAFDMAERDVPQCGHVMRGDQGEQYVCALHPAHVNGPETDHTDLYGLARWPSSVST